MKKSILLERDPLNRSKSWGIKRRMEVLGQYNNRCANWQVKSIVFEVSFELVPISHLDSRISVGQNIELFRVCDCSIFDTANVETFFLFHVSISRTILTATCWILVHKSLGVMLPHDHWPDFVICSKTDKRVLRLMRSGSGEIDWKNYL